MWNMISCSVQGRGHMAAEIPCQDKTWTLSENGVYVIALADGAGSAKLSHYGAEALVKHISQEICRQFDVWYGNEEGADVKYQIYGAIRKCLLNTARRHSCCNIHELASTLLVAAVKDNRFILVHIGDGIIGYLKSDILKVASYPNNGEFINTTVLTTSGDVLRNMKMIKGTLDDIRGFVLISDGSEQSLYQRRQRQLSGALRKIMELSAVLVPDGMEKKLQDYFENKIRMKTKDDCSIAVLVRSPKGCQSYQKIPSSEKRKMLMVSPKMPRKALKRYGTILRLLEEPQDVFMVSRCLHMKYSYAKQYLDRLCRLSLVEKEGRMYHSLLISDAEQNIKKNSE